MVSLEGDNLVVFFFYLNVSEILCFGYLIIVVLLEHMTWLLTYSTKHLVIFIHLLVWSMAISTKAQFSPICWDTTCDKMFKWFATGQSMVVSGYSVYVHWYNYMYLPRYNWNSVEIGIEQPHYPDTSTCIIWLTHFQADN